MIFALRRTSAYKRNQCSSTDAQGSLHVLDVPELQLTWFELTSRQQTSPLGCAGAGNHLKHVLSSSTGERCVKSHVALKYLNPMFKFAAL